MLRTTLALAALCLLTLPAALSPVAAQDKEGDFPKWNTWKTSAKGDWVEYTLSLGPKVRFEVLDAPAGGKIKYSHKMLDASGKETSAKELEKDWNAIRLQATPSPRAEVTWRDGELETCGQKLKCRVASWKVERIVDEIWYSVDVPCGGVVKQTSGGSDTVSLTGFKTAKITGTVKPENGDKPATDVKMPRFFAKVGNAAVYKVTTPAATIYQRREITSVEGDTATYDQAGCDAKGVVADDAKHIEGKQTKAKWDEDFAEAAEKDVKVKVGAGEFVCQKFVKESTSMTTTTWINDGVVVKLHVKRDMGAGKPSVETTMELEILTLK